MKDSQLKDRVEKAIRQFWSVREDQGKRQGKKSDKDRGTRSKVTGGRQLDGFTQLFCELCQDAGVQEDSIRIGTKEVILPGFFRPTKRWDLIVVVDNCLLAVIELKSQLGSLGNNANNRAEEAIGNAHDFWTAYREGAFKPSPRPWLGYLFLLEDSEKSNAPVKVDEPHFKVFPEFKDASYVDRYSILCRKLLRERMYDAAALILSVPNSTANGEFSEPEPEATISRFTKSLVAHVSTNIN
ncbi:MAG: hypothetical protein JKY96_05725 [Phycisphaerales bacterium]|nr:hypothetical protein [Phycisphaerales bacterium]